MIDPKDKSKYEILYMYPCLSTGWEMDNEGYIVRRLSDDKVIVMESSHGQFYEMESDKAISTLNNWIIEYSSILDRVRKAVKTFATESRNKRDNGTGKV
jgi:hypothetical protein